MANSILDLITEKYDSFTPSEKKLSNYILTHSSETQYLSIHTLSQNSHVSESTITRFCRTLGLSNYHSFKISLAKSEHAADLGHWEELSADFGGKDGLKQLTEQLYESYLTSLKETIEQLDPRSFDRAADLISSARHVYCFGQGSSMVIAMEAWARFSACSSSFVHIADSHLQSMAASLATSADAILYFSYSGATREYQDIAKLARERSIPIILLTHFRNSSATHSADVTLSYGFNESPLQSGSIAAKMGQLLLIDCLYAAYCRKNPEVAAAASATADAIAQKHL